MASHIERRKFLATLGGAVAGWPLAARAQELGVIDAIKTAVDAYICGYPLVTFDMVRRQQTTSPCPTPSTPPWGR